MFKRGDAARAFGWLVLALGLAGLLSAAGVWRLEIRGPFLAYLSLALLASMLSAKSIPFEGSMGLNFLFVLLGLAELGFSQALVLGCSGAVVQAALRERITRGKLWGVAYQVASTAVAISIADAAYRASRTGADTANALVSIAVAGSVLYGMNTLPIAARSSLVQKKNLASVWRDCTLWTFPNYLAGTVVAGLIYSYRGLPGDGRVLLLPVAFLIYCSLYLYLQRLSTERTQLSSIGSMHARTMQALTMAMAVESKGAGTLEHLRRLQVFCTEIGRELGLGGQELDALATAAVLRDIGQLAVPDRILSKPSGLTAEEQEKVKAHPAIGAGMLEQVGFSADVVALVHSHHENWDGTGYPHRLQGEQIPLGARVLAVVDNWSALLSNRRHRPAMDLEEAINRIVQQSDRRFDPAVVAVLVRRYLNLEAAVRSNVYFGSEDRDESMACRLPDSGGPATSADVDREPGSTRSGRKQPRHSPAAVEEVRSLLDLAKELGSEVNLARILMLLCERLQHVVPFDSIAMYVLDGKKLIPRYAQGDLMARLLAREIPVGDGLVGWVVEHREPVLNLNPCVEIGLDRAGSSAQLLGPAMALPLAGTDEIRGVILLNRNRQVPFTTDELENLSAALSVLGEILENSCRYEHSMDLASTDYLTGLPNVGSLFSRLDIELGRCRRVGGSLTVLVCQLTGFEKLRDAYGHQESNKVLCAVSEALRLSSRNYEFVACSGGDEFTLVVPELKPEDLAVKTKHMAAAAFNAGKAVRADLDLTIGVGYSRYPEDGEEAEQLVACAGKRLEEASLEPSIGALETLKANGDGRFSRQRQGRGSIAAD